MSPTTPNASAPAPATPAKRNKKEVLPTSQLGLATLGTAAAKKLFKLAGGRWRSTPNF